MSDRWTTTTTALPHPRQIRHPFLIWRIASLLAVNLPVRMHHFESIVEKHQQILDAEID